MACVSRRARQWAVSNAGRAWNRVILNPHTCHTAHTLVRALYVVQVALELFRGSYSSHMAAMLRLLPDTSDARLLFLKVCCVGQHPSLGNLFHSVPPHWYGRHDSILGRQSVWQGGHLL